MSTKQGSGSIPVQQWFNLALTRAAVQDGAWQQFPSNEYLCNRWCRHRGQSSATIHCVISERFEVSWILLLHVEAHACTKTHIAHMQWCKNFVHALADFLNAPNFIERQHTHTCTVLYKYQHTHTLANKLHCCVWKRVEGGEAESWFGRVEFFQMTN